MFYRSILKELENWRVSPFRKPLIIRGARQVGKTTVVNTFGQQFEQYIYLNLEKKADRELFDENLDINEIVDRIFLIKGMKRSLIQNTHFPHQQLKVSVHRESKNCTTSSKASR